MFTFVIGSLMVFQTGLHLAHRAQVQVPSRCTRVAPPGSPPVCRWQMWRLP
ncbi:hypothetical protein [Paenibacillus sp. J45TS6]|uniref:hypothetical protein n=1 Tax=Paenibacillus sp. J45TS6 TaxID=2807196 RepID=UPI001BD10BD7|nr:hypothetical protein [Paenibacillus sp. J45TS6]